MVSEVLVNMVLVVEVEYKIIDIFFKSQSLQGSYQVLNIPDLLSICIVRAKLEKKRVFSII